MGIDAMYQALPATSEVLSYAVAHPSAAGMFPFLFEAVGRPNADSPSFLDKRDDAERELIRISAEEFAQHPGLATRHYDENSRRYGMLHYLLSEPVRTGAERISDLGTSMIRGAETIEKIQEWLDYSCRWTPPPLVREIAAWTAPMTEEELREHYDPVAMDEQHVYKFAARDGAYEWPHIWTLFTELRAFYQTVAEHEEGVLVTFW